jgi:hypothetical protein
MGRAKSMWLEAQERGWSTPDKFVCPDCVTDDHLKQLVEDAACSTLCDYCGMQAASNISAPIEEIMPAIMGALRHFFAEPAGAGTPYDGG